MKSIIDRVKSVIAGLMPSINRASQKQTRFQATKEYFRKQSTRGRAARKTEERRIFTFSKQISRVDGNVNPVKPTLKESLNKKISGSSLDVRWKKVSIIVLTVFCITALTGAGIAYSTENAFSVTVDGKHVAFIRDKGGAENALEDLKIEKAKQWNQKLMINEKVAFVAKEAKRYQVVDTAEVKEILDNELTFVGVAAGIQVNGKIVAVVKDEEAANQVLEILKKRFTDSLNNMQAESVLFKEKIEIVDTPANLNNVADVNEVVDKLINGEEKAKVHVVKEGESLWTIARKNDTHVVDLKAANPELKGDNPKLDIGQELKLVKVEPLVTVKVTAEATVKETIPYKVKVKTDKSMYKGKQQVKEKGENGSREVTYKLVFENGVEAKREVLKEKVLKPAKDQVVVRGSKLVVASRGGNGTLAWPVSGKITSKFGRRWGSMHTGLDIDGYTGQPIGAADDGKVVSAGWDGAYGKQVTIDHGNGMKTKYAHMSKIEVSVGDRVSRGELIGKVGNTGRSTGSHLHFEVIVGGGFRNPLNYLK